MPDSPSRDGSADASRDRDRAAGAPPRHPDDIDRADDVGRTTGGGSLGHDQPVEVKRDTPLRNNATGSDDDPVMPRDDATLKTKI